VRKGFQVSYSSVLQDLEDIFQEMEKNARTDPRLEALLDKSKYPLVVLADEILLNSGWEEASTWSGSGTLEEKFFGTNIGGDKIFQIASDLHYDDVELASILFVAIGLGVEGPYHERPSELAEVKSKLYRQLSEYLADAQQQITPDAYRVQEKSSVRLSRAVTLGRILIVAGGLVILYWVASLLSWGAMVGDLRDLVKGIS